jgi:saccharopine dehydrogenase (NAD+, L-lysine-forming)
MTRLRGPDGYTFTVRAALAVVERVLAVEAPPGFQTPSTAYGADFVLGLEGVARHDG